jgi:hypothetical protein
MGMTDLDKMITVPAHELRLWRDTLLGEKWSLKHEGESSLTHPWINGVSLLDMMVASLEGHLIANDADWPKGEFDFPDYDVLDEDPGFFDDE